MNKTQISRKGISELLEKFIPKEHAEQARKTIDMLVSQGCPLPERLSINRNGGVEVRYLKKDEYEILINHEPKANAYSLTINDAAIRFNNVVTEEECCKAVHTYLTRKKIQDFGNLKDNWDGYGARPIKQEVIQKAMNDLGEIMTKTKLIPDAVCPCPKGGIQFEYNRNNQSIEIELQPNGTYSLLFEDKTDISEHKSLTLADACIKISEFYKKPTQASPASPQ